MKVTIETSSNAPNWLYFYVVCFVMGSVFYASNVIIFSKLFTYCHSIIS